MSEYGSILECPKSNLKKTETVQIQIKALRKHLLAKTHQNPRSVTWVQFGPLRVENAAIRALKVSDAIRGLASPQVLCAWTSGEKTPKLLGTTGVGVSRGN
ncbi:hypothetical protein N7447_001028 [Penicillium robsamsonii]|uniref:uncharacterized protein n=1 Tax=Penicillium robsamsonii TaxID=1792511 RepID=UPI002547C71B|nr:uncharacterized protein N7447_001028 [Penicillium robsamsonii]KAJ5835002.1 hypothetical protein N7447_001028 [Penicillium robsamsonii]